METVLVIWASFSVLVLTITVLEVLVHAPAGDDSLSIRAAHYAALPTRRHRAVAKMAALYPAYSSRWAKDLVD
jgi:hypothetical protein